MTAQNETHEIKNFRELENSVSDKDFLSRPAPSHNWFLKNKQAVFELFLSRSFSTRKEFNRMKMLISFQRYLDKYENNPDYFWKAVLTELLLRKNEVTESINKPMKKKKVIQKEVKIDNRIFKRNLIKTGLFKKNDDFIRLITEQISDNLDLIEKGRKWFVIVSEKIIAVSQGRSYFLWEIKPSSLAYFLSKYVKKTRHGIGLGSPWTMELAIREAGWLRIIIASVFSALFKIIGVNGIFYNIAGSKARSIDGPTEYSLYPANLSAKLGPENPESVASELKRSISKIADDHFAGTVIIDANDLGQNILANSTNIKEDFIIGMMRDNPMGQSDEQTPILIVQYN